MTRLPILLIAGAILSGCATDPPNPWVEIPVPEGKAERPLELPVWPVPDDITDERIAYALPGVRDLDAYRTSAITNTRIAEAHADEIDSLRTAVGDLTEAGKHQRRIADLRAEALDDARKSRFWDSIQYWIVILILAAT